MANWQEEYGDQFSTRNIPEKYRDNITASANNGYVYAQHSLANHLRHQKEYTKAYKWMKRAADQGYVPAVIKKTIVDNIEHLGKEPDVGPFLALAMTGDYQIYSALSYHYSHVSLTSKLKRNVPKAQSYADLVKFFGGEIPEKYAFDIFFGRPAEEIEASNKLAMEWLMGWAKDPATYLGKASAWCFEQNQTTAIECVRDAVSDHEICSLHYLDIGFENFIYFPSYKKCRRDIYKFGELNLIPSIIYVR